MKLTLADSLKLRVHLGMIEQNPETLQLLRNHEGELALLMRQLTETAAAVRIVLLEVQAQGDTFSCEHCGNTYTKARSDEEAEAEREKLWGSPKEEGDAVLCDDCFHELKDRIT